MNKKMYMKIIKKFLIAIFIFLSFVTTTKAYVCEYDEFGVSIEYDEAGTPTVYQTKYKEINTPIIVNFLVNYENGNIITTNKLDTLSANYIGYCPESIYACTYEYSGHFNVGTGIADAVTGESKALIYSNQKYIYLFSSEDEMKKDGDLGDLPNGEKVNGHEAIDNLQVGYDWTMEWCKVPVLCHVAGGISGIVTGLTISSYENMAESLTFYYSQEKNCMTTDYTGSGPVFNLACQNLQAYQDNVISAIASYKECKSNDAVCISKTITAVNSAEDTLKAYCRTILAEQNFDGGVEEDCIRGCINIGVKTKRWKEDAGIISGDSGECGFSARLLVWVSNILRWIKYILPVIVIVMGILDFIKAIATDKDDAMKKAQGSFIKRLVAAALVFIIPLIIEFILDKMGFGYNDCGLF